MLLGKKRVPHGFFECFKGLVFERDLFVPVTFPFIGNFTWGFYKRQIKKPFRAPETFFEEFKGMLVQTQFQQEIIGIIDKWYLLIYYVLLTQGLESIHFCFFLLRQVYHESLGELKNVS